MAQAGSGSRGMPRPEHATSVKVKRALRRLTQNSTAGASAGTQLTTFAALPAAGTAPGTLYLISDINISVLDTGSGYYVLGPQLSGANLPLAASYTWLNQGRATVDFSHGPMKLFTFGDGTAAWHFNGQQQPAPTAPYSLFSQFAVNMAVGSGVYNTGGLFFYDSISKKIITFAVGWRPDTATKGGACLSIQYWTDFTTVAADVLLTAAPPFSGPPWLGIQRDGVSRNYLYSSDGADFMRIYTEADGTNGVAPDTVGFSLQWYDVPALNQISVTAYAAHN